MGEARSGAPFMSDCDLDRSVTLPLIQTCPQPNRFQWASLRLKSFVIGPNALLKRTIVGIAVSFLWLANVVYASGGGSSPGGPGLPVRFNIH
jgi:hypothetical protein